MKNSPSRSYSREFLSELERKSFWWEPVGPEPRAEIRILAQAMSMAGFDEARRLERVAGCDRLVETMLQAAPGWIDERSWEYWRGRLTHVTGRTLPGAAPARLFDAGVV